MTKIIPYLRRTIQALSFFFLLYLVVRTAFPLELKIPVDLYLRLDPFVAIISILTHKGIIERMLPAFGVLLLVMIFGNFFCGWLCPMGAVIDFFDRLLFREKNGPNRLTINRSEGFATASLFSPSLLASWLSR